LEAVSVANYIDDVNKDQVIIIDGLTKSFRYPGWRLGPKGVIENINRAASAIDGGPSQPIQRAALQVLEPQRAEM
jgi:aspartate/methionine/tyrosine aminotransferase